MRLGFSVAAHIQRRCAAARRGLRRRRRGLPAQVLRQDPRVQAAAAARSCSSPTTRRRSSGCASGPCCSGRARSSSTGRRREAIARYRQLLAEDAKPRRACRRTARVGQRRGADRRGAAARLGRRRAARSSAAARRLVVRLVVAADRDVLPPKVSLELRDDDGVVLGGGHAVDSTSSAGTGTRASARCGSSSTACRWPRAASICAARWSRLRAGGCCTRSTTLVRFFVFPTGTQTGAVFLDGRWSDEGDRRRRANRVSCELPHLPRLAAADGDRAGASVQALHPARGSAAGRRARLARAPRVRRDRRSAATSPATCSTPSTPIRRSPRPCAPPTGSTSASGPRARRAATRSPTRALARRGHPQARASLRADAVAQSFPSAGQKGKSRLGRSTPAARAALARAMLADVVAACAAVGATYVVAPDDVTLARRDGRRSTRAAARARRCVPGLDAAAAATGEATLFLVVNADLPCVTPRDLLALAGAVPDRGHRARGGRRRDDERARLRLARPLRAALRRRAARRASRRSPRRASSTRRTSSTTSTRSPTSSGSRDAARPAHPQGARARCALGAVRREGDRALGRRRRRAVPARTRRCRRSRQRFHHRQRGGRRRGARAARLARPRQHPLRARRASRTRSAAGAAPTRPGTRSRLSPSSAARLVSARRPRHRPAPRAHAVAARGLAALGGHRAARSAPSGSVARCSRPPTSRCARSSRPRRARSPSRRGSSRAATRTRSTRCTTPARPTLARRRA